MMLRKWDELPADMQNEAILPYYRHLETRKASLILKRLFDITVALVMLIILSPVFILISIMIAIDSKGGVFFRQERVTQYGRVFRIFKFRTMVADAESLGSQVTVKNDMRVTKVGRVLRKYRLDELPQLINIVTGDMSFVGTRPEVVKYVERYTPEMKATLLLPAGVTSEASIKYKDEAKLLENTEDADKAYIESILPAKMYYNLKEFENYSFGDDIRVMIMTLFAVCGKEYRENYIPREDTQ